MVMLPFSEMGQSGAGAGLEGWRSTIWGYVKCEVPFEMKETCWQSRIRSERNQCRLFFLYPMFSFEKRAGWGVVS